VTASHPEAVGLYGEPMYKPDLLKVDPVAHLLILVVIALEIYTGFLRSPDVNEVDRQLLEDTLAACSR
jgi:hypothetical protein